MFYLPWEDNWGKRQIYVRQKLCYGCLTQVSKEHGAKNCSKRRSCEVSKEGHLPTHHGLKLEKRSKNGNDENNDSTDPLSKNEKDQTNAFGKFHCTYAGIDMVSMCVVQIKVSHK